MRIPDWRINNTYHASPGCKSAFDPIETLRSRGNLERGCRLKTLAYMYMIGGLDSCTGPKMFRSH